MIDEREKIWINGMYVPWNDAKIHVLTHSLHYGTGVFEGIRCYKTINKKRAIFRLDDHINRFINSSKIYFMKVEYSKSELHDIIVELVKNSKFDECYVRPIAYYSYGKMGVNPLPNTTSVSIAAWKWDEYLKKDIKDVGIKAMISSWARIDGRTMPVHAKSTANYANSALARIDALNSGFDEAIMLNTNGMVVEASAENIFIVKNDLLMTPPISSGALDGITRDSVLKLAKEYGIDHEVVDVSRDELYIADEVFLTGTAAEIKTVSEIDNRMIGNNKKYNITNKLKQMFESVVKGTDEKFSDQWLTYID